MLLRDELVLVLKTFWCDFLSSSEIYAISADIWKCFFKNIIFSYLLALDLLEKSNVLCYFSIQDFTSWINYTFTCSLSQVLSLFKVEISLFENVSFRMKIYTDIFQICSRLHCHQTLEWDYLQYVISQNIIFLLSK